MTAKSDSDEVARLAEEFLARCRNGSPPKLEEYTTAYPHLAERIRDIFPAILFAENIGPAWEPSVPTAGPVPSAPQFLGDYRILREIGRGGMGVVYEAVQESLSRHVALKVLPATSLLSPTFRERFQREARAAARMHHSNIVPVFGVGEHDGTHYYAMQFIAGQGLDAILKEAHKARGHAKTIGGNHKTPMSELAESFANGRFVCIDPTFNDGNRTPGQLSSDSHIEYFRGVARIGWQVANALSYAHRQGILHRDIKPSNLLMDVEGTVWVTDFGLAKSDDDVELTHSGDFVGTIRYMAPERFRGESTPVGDVYSLGVTLYELLTLRPAYFETDRAQLMQQVLNCAPLPPSRLDARIPRDLDTIVNKAMAREVRDRYASADELADDLNRFLTDRPIMARPTPWTERTWRWCRRNPRVASLLGLVAVLLLIIAIGSPIMSWRLYDQRQVARQELWNAELARAKAQRLTNEPGRRAIGVEALDRARLLLPSLQDMDGRREQLRNELIACLSLSDLRQQLVGSGLPVNTTAVCFDSNCQIYAIGDDQGMVSIRRVVDDRETSKLPAVGIGAWGIKFSPNGKFLAVGYHHKNRFNSEQFRVWEVATQREVLAVNSPTGCGEADFSPDSTRIAFGRDNNQLAIHDLTNEGAPGQSFAMKSLPSAIAFHPDGQRLAVAVGRAVEVRDAATGQLVSQRTQNVNVWNLAWHPNGKQLALGVGQNIYWLDSIDDAAPAVFRGHEGVIYALAISPDGRFLASKAYDGTMRWWDVTTRQQLIRTPTVYTGCTPICFSSDGQRIGYASDGRTMWLWQVNAGHECRALAVPRSTTSLQSFAGDFTPDGRFVAIGSTHGLHCFDCLGGELIFQWDAKSNWGVRFINQGRQLLTSSGNGLQIWPIKTDNSGTITVENQPKSIGQEGQLQSLDLSGDEKIVAVKRYEGPIVVYKTGSATNAMVLADHAQANAVAVSPDGRLIATGTNFGRDVFIWNAADGKQVAVIPCDSSAGVRFSPDGLNLLVALEREYILFNVGSWDKKWSIAKEPETLPGAMSYSKDGKLLAVRYSPTTLWFVDPQTGLRLAELQAPNHQILFWHQLSHDGNRMAAAGLGNIIHMWDLRRIREQLRERNLDW